jgi:hypothetical protein
VKEWNDRFDMCTVKTPNLDCRRTREWVEKRGTLGWQNRLQYEEGHGPSGKGIASPLVSAGQAEARGPDRIPFFDCSQSDPLSFLSTGLCVCDPLVDSELTHGSVDSSDYSTNLEGNFSAHYELSIARLSLATFGRGFFLRGTYSLK